MFYYIFRPPSPETPSEQWADIQVALLEIVKGFHELKLLKEAAMATDKEECKALLEASHMAADLSSSQKHERFSVVEHDAMRVQSQRITKAKNDELDKEFQAWWTHGRLVVMLMLIMTSLGFGQSPELVLVHLCDAFNPPESDMRRRS